MRCGPYISAARAREYLAAVRTDELPRKKRTDAQIIRRGYAVGVGQWFFFEALEPAVAFGRAARMSLDCRGCGAYEAAHVTQFCDRHNVDERVLQINLKAKVDHAADEVEVLKRFTQGVNEHPWSARWHALTGYITDYNNGRPTKTSRRSLPL